MSLKMKLKLFLYFGGRFTPLAPRRKVPEIDFKILHVDPIICEILEKEFGY